jgi:lipid-A-disaccharide synthase
MLFMPAPSIMFVAGDPSGDQHASAILRRISTLAPGVRCFGIGGPAMQSIGFEPLMRFEDFNRMGLWEVLVHLPFFLTAKKFLKTAMDSNKPKALVCVDYPGLNIPLMKEAHKRGIPVVWYIVPQVWAWKKKRAALLGKYASFIGAVFPFEVDFFKSFAAPVSFVGHPIVEALQQKNIDGGADELINRHDPGFTLSLVPGSRRQEVTAILPAMIAAAALLKRQYPNLRVFVSKCHNLPVELYQPACSRTGINVFEGPLGELLERTRYAFVTSGTATLETALAGVPMVIVYRTSALTYGLLKRMVRVPFIGLPNIVAGEKIVPECIQWKATGTELAREMKKYIESPAFYESTVEKLSRLKGLLGGKKPSHEVASAIVSIVNNMA